MSNEGYMIVVVILSVVAVFTLFRFALFVNKRVPNGQKNQEKLKLLQQVKQKYAPEEWEKELERMIKEKEKREEFSLVNNVQSGAKFINDATHKLKKQINNSVSKHYLTSFGWVLIEYDNNFTVYHFKSNNEVIVTINGDVYRGQFELMHHNNGLLLTLNGKTEHFNFINIQNDYFFINKLSTQNVIGFVNQAKYQDYNKDWFYREIEKAKGLL